jgi:hypothetical protein
MRDSMLPALLVGLFTLVSWTANPAVAASPRVHGKIVGIEICPQSVCGAAVFLFEFRGELNDRPARGFGWIAIVHEDLPAPNAESDILYGTGVLTIGLHRLEIGAIGGHLYGADLIGEHGSDVFGVDAALVICNRRGQCGSHVFEHGLLDHETLIPTIEGDVSFVFGE